MTEATREKMLERVRALLAKADGTEFEGEAAVFRAKADQLMTQYAIDQWMVDQAQKGKTERPKPEVRDISFYWYWATKDYDRRQDLYSIWYRIAEHCRVVVAYRAPWVSGKATVIGIPSDIDYMDMLFTNVMLQLSKAIEPPLDKSKSRAENVYIMRSAGQSREWIGEQMWKAGMIHASPAMLAKYGVNRDDPWNWLPEPFRKNIRQRLRKELHEHCKDNGLAVPNVNPAVYRRSFSQGFVLEIAARLRDMARANQPAPDSGNPMALALRDIRQQALDLYEELWPSPVFCRYCGHAGEDPCSDTAACKRRQEANAKRKGRAIAAPKPRAFSNAAYRDGKVAGSKADIAASPNQGLGTNRPSLPR